MEKKQFALGFI